MEEVFTSTNEIAALGALCYNQTVSVLREGNMPSALRKNPPRPDRFHEALTSAQETGLLRGAKTEIVRGRMPKALVRKAKATSGARSATELIEMALANLAVADQYPDWLLSQRGTVGKEVDLEF
jgi:hypothetical protein